MENTKRGVGKSQSHSRKHNTQHAALAARIEVVLVWGLGSIGPKL